MMHTPSFLCAPAKAASLLVSFLFATQVQAQTPLLEVFAACEASVMQGDDDPLRRIGPIIDENKNRTRVRVDTPKGTLIAMFLPPTGPVSACILWGRHPELAEGFQEHWQDWVEWEEAAQASGNWFNSAMQTQGSVDLTDHSQPGYVVARCDHLENGVVLTSQPEITNIMRQILPELEPKKTPVIFYKFSAIAALPNRCAAAVKVHKFRN